MLSADQLFWKQGEKTILRGIDFHLMEGEIVGLVGPNGSGKSSLLKLLSFLERPTTGRMIFQGVPITGKVPLQIRRQIAIVFQQPLLLNTSVFENVAAGLRIRRIPRKEIETRVAAWLDQFGISHLRKQPAHSLSGGEAQRVSLARAFVLDPKIIFLDEPFSQLDAPTKEGLLTDLQLVLETSKKTAVLVSHDFRDILRLTQRAAVLLNGKIVAEGEPRQLLHSQQPTEVEQFLGLWR